MAKDKADGLDKTFRKPLLNDDEVKQSNYDKGLHKGLTDIPDKIEEIKNLIIERDKK